MESMGRKKPRGRRSFTACRAIVDYIAWYNGTRPDRTLGYRSPAESGNDHHDTISKVA